MAPPRVTAAPRITLEWLVRLRWGAVGGQLFTIAFVNLVLGVDLPIAGLVGIIGVTTVTNLVLWQLLQTDHVPSAPVIGVILVLDTLLLTAMLALSGGPSNPFGALYLLHVTLAVVLLGGRWGTGIVALSAACAGVLF